MTVQQLLVVSAMLGVAACASEPVPPDQAPATTPTALPVATVTAETWPDATESGGVVRARLVAPVASRVLAPVLDVPVRAGDRVTRGQVVARLDVEEAAARAVQATAALAAAARRHEAAGADVEAADAALTLAAATRERIAALFDQRSATAQERDEATAAHRAADAGTIAARARLAEAAAALDAARAAAEAADTAAGYAVVRAPFDGVVASRVMDPGGVAQPGMPLLIIEDTSAYELEVPVDATRLRHLADGDSVEARVDGGTWAPAQVLEVAHVDPATQTMRVRLALPVQPGLRSGLFGRARLSTTTRDVLTVPVDAIVRRGQVAFVFVLDEADRARLRAITAGDTRDGRVAVLAGLDGGEHVVAAPTPGLADGTPVAPVGAAQ